MEDVQEPCSTVEIMVAQCTYSRWQNEDADSHKLRVVVTISAKSVYVNAVTLQVSQSVPPQCTGPGTFFLSEMFVPCLHYSFNVSSHSLHYKHGVSGPLPIAFDFLLNSFCSPLPFRFISIPFHSPECWSVCTSSKTGSTCRSASAHGEVLLPQWQCH